MSTKASRLKKAASVKINHHIGGLRTTIPAQMAVAGPPLATQLGQLGINIQQFVKDFNLRTSIYKEGVPLPTRTTINPDRSYNLVIHHPTNTYLLKQAAGVKRGPQYLGQEVCGYITRWVWSRLCGSNNDSYLYRHSGNISTRSLSSRARTLRCRWLICRMSAGS